MNNEGGEGPGKSSSDHQLYFMEDDEVHLFDVVDRVLTAMFRNTSQHRYMRSFKEALCVVQVLA